MDLHRSQLPEVKLRAGHANDKGRTFHGVDKGAVSPAEPLCVALAGSWIALLLHELGHAAAAGLLGVRIWGIRLG